MPVVTLYFDRLQKLVGKKTSKEKIIATLPFIGLDIEEQTKDYISVEYSPNRPDYSTDYGIASSLQGLLEIKKGIPKMKLKNANFVIKIDSSVKNIRPFVVAIVAKNGSFDDETIRQIISMQEDLHNGIGRKRKKISIGIHDLDKLSFPLIYTTAKRNHKFVPLGSSNEMSISEILEKTDVGIRYKEILKNATRVPIILNSNGQTISFPPIINSNLTNLSKSTKNVLVEITAIDKNIADDALAIISNMLQYAGFDLFLVKISGGHMPSLDSKTVILDPDLVNQTLGLDISSSIIISCLKKTRLDAILKKGKIMCTIPRYRTDIFGPMDLVEEVALGFGIENLEPTFPPSVSSGQKNHIEKTLDSLGQIMVGLGYSEVVNFSLVSKQVQYDLSKRDQTNMISVLNSKSQEHTLLRDSVLPGLIDVLSRNVHEAYPQKLFEIGTVFSKVNNSVIENISLACVSAHTDVSFTEAKAVLQSVLKTGFDMKCTTQMSSNPMFSDGRMADIVINEKTVGLIGEISPQVIDNFKIRMPVVGFEIKLSGLIFD